MIVNNYITTISFVNLAYYIVRIFKSVTVFFMLVACTTKAANFIKISMQVTRVDSVDRGRWAVTLFSRRLRMCEWCT